MAHSLLCATIYALLGLVGSITVAQAGSESPAQVSGTAQAGKAAGAAPEKTHAGHDKGAKQVRGVWQVMQKSMISPADPVALLQLDIRPPREYTVSLKVRRQSGANTFAVGLPVGDTQVLLALDSHGGQFSGLEYLDGKSVNDNEATRRGTLLELNRDVTMTCTVRKDRITCFVDGVKTVDWQGDPKRLSLPRDFEVPDRRALFLATISSRFAVRNISVSSPDDAPPVFPKLLEGTPTVSHVTIDEVEFGDLRIDATISDRDELCIYRDRAEWKHLSGGLPSAVRLNNVEWKVIDQALLNTGNTEFLADNRNFAGCTLTVVEGRGTVRFAVAPDHIKIMITDPDPGAGNYAIVVNQGLALPPYAPPGQAAAKVTAGFQLSPRRPLPLPGVAPDHLDFERQKLEFRRSRLALAYDKFGHHDARWDEATRAFLERVANTIKSDPIVELVADGEEVINKGCDDALVCCIHAWHLWRWGELVQAEPLALHAALAFEKSNYPKSAARFAPLLLARIYQKQTGEKRRRGYSLLQRGIEETADALCEQFSAGEERSILDEIEDDLNLRSHSLLMNRYGLAKAVAARGDVKPWLQHLLLARYHTSQAWQERGTGWADSVSEEGWEGFGFGIEQARAHLLTAWLLRPENPEAAVGLIRTTMAKGGIAGESTRYWFDEAVVAQFDAPGAYETLLFDLLPRWGGSHAELLDFGLECLNTGRFDTEVPRSLLRAAVQIELEGGDLRQMLEKRDASGALDAALTGYESQKATDAEALKRLKTEHLIYCWRRGWRSEATKRLSDLGDQTDVATLNRYHVTIEGIREDLSSPPELYSRLPQLSVLQPDVRIAEGPVAQVAISPDGSQLAIASAAKGGSVQVVKLSGESTQTWPIDESCFIPRLQFSPDGILLAGQVFGVLKLPSNQQFRWGTVTTWRIGDEKSRDMIPRKRATVDAFCWVRSWRWMAVGLNNSVIILDAVTGQRVATTTEPMSHCIALAAPPGGEFLVSGHEDGSVGLWEIPVAEDLGKSTSAPIKKLSLSKQHDSAVVDLEVSSDGKRLASCSNKDRTVWLWDVTTRMPLKRLNGGRIAISPDGRLLATCDGATADLKMAVWSAESGEPLGRIPDRDAGAFVDVIFHPDGVKILGVTENGTMRTWGLLQNDDDPAP